jgi:tetratricopeptide (TPR) repeat protein
MTARPTVPLSALPANIKSLVDKAQNAVRMNNHEYAVQIMQAILKEYPDYLEGRQLARNAAVVVKSNASKKMLDTSGITLMKIQPKAKKEPETALIELEGVLASDPFNLQANQLLFEAADTLDMVDTAAFAMETIRKGHPKNTKLHHKLAGYYMVHEMFDKAGKVFEGILQVEPTDGEARKGYTNANAKHTMSVQKGLGGGNVSGFVKDKSAQEKEELLAKQSLTPEQAEKLLDYLNKDYAANQQDPNPVRKIAETYEKIEKWEEALQFYAYGLSLSPGDTAMERKVQRLEDKLREIHLATIRAWLDENPDHPEAEAQREIIAQLKRERAEGNLSLAKEAVERNPTDAQLRYELGVQLVEAGHPGEAIPELQKAKSNPGIRTKAMLTLATCFVARNMADMASRQLEELVREIAVMDATKIEALYQLGHVYRNASKKQEALDCWKQIYEVDYHYKDVAKLVEESYDS